MPSFTVFKGSEGGKIVKGTSSRELGPKDVLIRVTHSGLCGTDMHYRGGDVALGHEGAGIIEDVGSDVKLFKKGDRAGWGYEHDSCGHCKHCLTGTETFCPERQMYGMADLDQGSFASHAVWKEDFVFKIPDSIDNAHAAPLMCGGATVFAALAMYGVRPTDRVGVIGVGGLGHLAIQFLRAMGCAVAVFSGTDSKKDEATRLGATEFYAAKGRSSLADVVKAPLDHLLVTTSVQPDWNMYLPLMQAGGTIFPLTVAGPDDTLSLPYMQFLLAGLRVQASVVAPRQVHREMLAFAARHGIKPIIQEFPMSEQGIEDAMETLDSGKMKYRGVLAWE